MTPRQARIDFPGALHHVMVRGLDRTELYRDDADREVFLGRLGEVLDKTNTTCRAFALMPNHFHLLLVSGDKSIGKTMQRLLTSYALYFNLRHRRSGRLYQNRFKSVLCDGNEYALELIRYIHLNPLRGGLVADMEALDLYPWGGHSVCMGKTKREWFCTEDVLGLFGNQVNEAKGRYRRFVQEGIAQGRRYDLTGGGLVRSMGGVWEVVKAARKGKREQGDERILGNGDFVREVLQQANENMKRTDALKKKGWDFHRVLRRAAEVVGLPPEELLQKGRANGRSQGRALLCKWLAIDLDTPHVDIAEALGVHRSAVTGLVSRGRQIEKEIGGHWLVN